LNVRFNLLFDERAVQSGIAAVQATVADGEGLVLAEIRGPVELRCDLLRPRAVSSEQPKSENGERPEHTGF